MAAPGSTDAVVTVRLNTSGAQRDLAALGGALGGMGGGLGFGGRSPAGFAMGSLAGAANAMVGNPVGMATGQLAAPSQGVIGGTFGETFGRLGSQFAAKGFGTLGPEANAAKRAREETIQAFGMIAGATGQIPAGAKEFFDQIKQLRGMEERGRQMFETQDEYYGPGASDAIKELGKSIISGFENVVLKVIQAIGGIKIG